MQTMLWNAQLWRKDSSYGKIPRMVIISRNEPAERKEVKNTTARERDNWFSMKASWNRRSHSTNMSWFQVKGKCRIETSIASEDKGRYNLVCRFRGLKFRQFLFETAYVLEKYKTMSSTKSKDINQKIRGWKRIEILSSHLGKPLARVS